MENGLVWDTMKRIDDIVKAGEVDVHTLQVALLAMILAQTLKIFTIRPFSISRFLGSGGMPSSHSAFVSSLSTMVGIRYGFNSDLFAVTAVFSLITMYDATGVRRAVGRQARVLNHLIRDFSEPHAPERIYGELKELVGHTPIEVFIGAIFGIVIALLFA